MVKRRWGEKKAKGEFAGRESIGDEVDEVLVVVGVLQSHPHHKIL
jgi:hypothetical protein